MWRLVLHKLFMSLLTVVCFFAGIVGYTLVLAPFNFTYLLHIPAEWETSFAWAFAGLFVCVATVLVRTDWFYQNDFLLPQPGEKWYHRFLRAATSREFLGDLIVCVFWWMVYIGIIVATNEVNWLKVAWRAPLLIVGNTLIFGVLDCLLYVIARKRADCRLSRNRQED